MSLHCTLLTLLLPRSRCAFSPHRFPWTVAVFEAGPASWALPLGPCLLGPASWALPPGSCLLGPASWVLPPGSCLLGPAMALMIMADRGPISCIAILQLPLLLRLSLVLLFLVVLTVSSGLLIILVIYIECSVTPLCCSFCTHDIYCTSVHP